MPKHALNPGNDFLFAKLHGRWSTALVGNRLDELIRGGSLQALGRILSPLGINIQAREDVQKNLTLSLIKEIGGLAGLLDETTATFFHRLLENYFLENLKTLIRYRYQQGTPDELSFLLVESEYLPRLPWDRMIQARTLHEFYSSIPETGYKKELLPILVEVDATHDIFVSDAKIDHLYFDRLLDSAGELARDKRGLAAELIGTDVDVRNILTAMRNVSLYRFKETELAPLFLGGGKTLTVSAALKLGTMKDLDKFWTGLPREYATATAPWIGAEHYLVENALWTLLNRKALRTFKDYSHPELSTVAYPFLKRFEFLNIARLFEGLYLKLDPEIIRSMMITC